MMFRIVPTYIADAINAKLDAAFAQCPDAAKDREILYGQLLDYFDEHGVVPDFKLGLKAKPGKP
jgi:hypothetical protein